MSFKVAIFTLNQWALDFEGNTKRIIKSIDEAHKAGAIFRVGPELEICSYSLEDSFFEQDTIHHCWSCLRKIADHSKQMNLVIDVGMPIYFNSLYNCRVLLFKGHILCIRAKTSLANEGNYREHRHFNKWPVSKGVVPFRLPSTFVEDGSEYVPFGSGFILELLIGRNHLKIGWEICQELWEMKDVSSQLCNDFGCHLVVNSSSSYWELRKLDNVLCLARSVSRRTGACYCFSNLVGCDGQRYVFYGRSFIMDKGDLVAQMSTRRDLFEEVSMITHCVDPKSIEEYRATNCIRPNLDNLQSVKIWNLNETDNDVSLLDNSYKIFQLRLEEAPAILKMVQRGSLESNLLFEAEIYHYVSIWLWDYLRRSNMAGFMMPLSGGLDSSCVATLVYCMCCILHQQLDNEAVQSYFNRRHKIPPQSIKQVLSSPAAICSRVLKCRYLSTDYSSQATENRARLLCKAIGADFDCVSIQELYAKCRQLGRGEGPTQQEVSLLEQNIQARLRMVLTYYLSDGNKIILATGNVDEGIMGYLTKYDCSSADINPIGGLCKADLKSFLRYCCNSKDVFAGQEDLVSTLEDIIQAPPSAELTGAEQRDEDEMGLTYDEISVLGRARRGIYGCSGPRGIFETVWRNRLNEPFRTKVRCLRTVDGQNDHSHLYEAAKNLAELVKRFYLRYSRNRHKLTVLTPALHAETYSPDDHRFDHRQILYPSLDYQFESINELVEQIKRSGDLDYR